MRTKRIALLMALSCTVLLGGAGPLHSQAQSQATDPSDTAAATSTRDSDRARNLGLATDFPMFVEGTTAVFTVLETAQQRDLNGDGDLNDRVAHVFDASTGEVRNLALNVNFGIELQGRVLTLCAPERPADLNGDGDVDDTVLQVYDTVRRSLTNLRLAGCGGGSFIDGGRVFLGVNENAQGQQDLNQDGDLTDRVLFIYDVETGSIQNTRLATFVSENDVLPDGRWIFAAVDEQNDGFTKTLHRFDTVTGVDQSFGVKISSFNPSFRSGFKVGDDQAFVVVRESSEVVDFNNDGDFADSQVRRIDLAAARAESTGLVLAEPVSLGSGPVQPQFFGAQTGLAVFNLAEADQGKDLNGDGDRNDVLLHTLTTATGQLHNLNVNGTFILSKSLPGRAVVFMNEVANGKDLSGDGRIGLDLNLDGKVDEFEGDFVLGLADLRGEQPRVVNTGLVITLQATLGFDAFFPSVGVQDAEAFQMSGNLVAFLVPEGRQGRDLNGDFIPTDHVLHIADLTTLTARNTGLSGAVAFRTAQSPLLPPVDGSIVVPVSEFRQGRPLNLDIDLADTVMQLVDVRSGRARTSGIAVASDLPGQGSFLRIELEQMIRGQTFVAVLVEESTTDLNSDGDMVDEVLHIFDVATGKLTNVGIAPRGMEPSGADFPEFDFKFAAACDGFGFFSSFEAECAGPRLGDAYTFLVSEAAQGNVDLNGDGDTNDFVVHATRLTDRDRNGRFDFAEKNAPRADESLQ